MSNKYILEHIKWSAEHLNKVGIRATMDSLLEEQRSVIKFLFLEGEKYCHIFQRLQQILSKACISRSTFNSWILQFREDKTSVREKPWPGGVGTGWVVGTEAVPPTMVANVEIFVNKDRRVTLQKVANQLSIG